LIIFFEGLVLITVVVLVIGLEIDQVEDRASEAEA
jgi:hypothetical protein